jgi:hypothetical protein
MDCSPVKNKQLLTKMETQLREKKRVHQLSVTFQIFSLSQRFGNGLV